MVTPESWTMHLGVGSLAPVDLLVELELLLVFDMLDEKRLIDDPDADPGARDPSRMEGPQSQARVLAQVHDPRDVEPLGQACRPDRPAVEIGMEQVPRRSTIFSVDRSQERRSTCQFEPDPGRYDGTDLIFPCDGIPGVVGCRRLLEEWTRLLEWLGRIEPEALATIEFGPRLDNLLRGWGCWACGSRTLGQAGRRDGRAAGVVVPPSLEGCRGLRDPRVHGARHRRG